MDTNRANEGPQGEDMKLSFREANHLLNAALDLEEQLYAMSLSDDASPTVAALWPSQVARTYSAYARLSSFAQYYDSERPVDQAELGLLNYEDDSKKLRHFMEPHVPIETIVDAS